MVTEQQSGEALSEFRRSGPYTSAVSWAEALSETQFAYLLLTPVLILLEVIAIYLLASTFSMSLYADQLTRSARPDEFVGLQNYTDLFTGARNYVLLSAFLPTSTPESPFVTNIYGSALMVTLVFTVFNTLFKTLIDFGQVLILDQDFRDWRWVHVAIIIPWAVPIVIQEMIWYLIFRSNIGFLVGTTRSPVLLSQPNLIGMTPLRNTVDSLFLIIVADVWKTSALTTLLILVGMQSIGRSLYNIAKVADASRWQQFRMITFLLTLPSVLVAMLFRAISVMRAYGIIEMMVGYQTAPSLLCLVITTFNAPLYGISAMVAFVTAGIIAIVVPVYIANFAGEDF